MGCEHIFPRDWRNMPIERVLLNIIDLQENHKLYMVYSSDINQIQVGEDITIKQTKDNTYVINGFKSPLINQELEYLWKLCTYTATPSEKASHVRPRIDDIIKKYKASTAIKLLDNKKIH